MCCGASSFGLSFIRNRKLFEELERMVEEDRRQHSDLASAVTSPDYACLDALHQSNADHLKILIAEYGWPGRSIVGEEGAIYAWMIVQHATCDIEFQRQCLALINSAVAHHEAPRSHSAYLEDQIRISEGRPQIYGTQFEMDNNGLMSPLPIEDAAHVNERRRAVGLDKLEHRVRVVRQQGAFEAASERKAA